jgi:DNA-binding MarR family transcriptional regulator
MAATTRGKSLPINIEVVAMGSIQDLLQEVPLAAVLRERVALADQKYEAAMQRVQELEQKVAELERQNAELRAQVPSHGKISISGDTCSVLAHIFRTKDLDARDVGAMAMALRMERGVLEYHLDRLHEAGFAEESGGNYLHGHVYWALLPEGRRYAVEHKLV